MARKPRIHFPGAVYHVILRGNGGQPIFFSKEDRRSFYLLLQDGIAKYGHRIHAFCLMSNHVHLAVQVAEQPLSRIIQNLSFRYTRFINQREKRAGHLFQGRYKAVLIDADSYLLELVRYIHLNPVRAGMVQSPGQYSWSSHRAYLAKEQLDWLTTDWCLARFSKKSKKAARQFHKFVLKGSPEGHRAEFHHGSVQGRLLGDDTFAEQALRQAEQKNPPRLTIVQLLDTVAAAWQLRPAELAAPGRQRQPAEARAVAALLVLESENLILADLGRHLGRDLSGLSKAAARLQNRLLAEPALLERVAAIRRSLT